jgi:glucokinase
MTLAIGIDLGGTKILAGVVDETGKMLEQIRVETHVSEGAAGVQNQLVDLVATLKANHQARSIGIGIAGQINPADGEVVFAPNLKWNHVPLQKNMTERTGLPTYVVNDVKAASWGEFRFGAGQGCQEMVCIFVGTGIGGGIISKGELLSGYTNTAGEVGHMIIDWKGPKCTCGSRGCFEAYAGGWAIAKRAQEKVAASPALGKTMLQMARGDPAAINGKIVAAAAQAGDKLATRLVDDIVSAMTAGCVSIVNALNPQRLVIGGGVITGMPFLIDRINPEIRKKALSAAVQKLEILKAFLADAGVLGAADLSLKR